MPGKTRKVNGDNPGNHTTHHTSSVDIKLLNELLQLLRKQALSSGVQPKKQAVSYTHLTLPTIYSV